MKNVNIGINLVSITIFVIGIWAALLANEDERLVGVMSRFLLILNVVVLYNMPSYLKEDLLKYISKVFALMLVPSLFLFVLFNIGFDVANLGWIKHRQFGYEFINHIFFLSGSYGIRFQSYFCEPGHLGMIIALLLYALKMNFRLWYVKIFMLSLLFTFSLAGYVLAFIGFLFISILQKRIAYTVRNILFFCCIMSCIMAGFYFTGKYSLMNEFIIERLAFDKNEGTIAGDNRVSYQVDRYIEDADFDTLLYGGVDLNINENLKGTGVKLYMLQFGAIAIFVLFLFYLLMLYKQRSFFGFLCLILFSFSFIQRCYALWFCELVIFVCSLSVGMHYKFIHNSK